jgi:Transposase DDE domain
VALDASGFIRRSQVFAGNAVEARTLERMLAGLHAPAGALVVMDRGIATEQNLTWLKGHGYRYLAVARAGARQFDPQAAIQINAAGGQPIGLQRLLSEDQQEVRLYCHSPGREQKEVAIVARLSQRFEQGLQKLAAGLAKPRGEKRLLKLTERIGRLKEKCHGIGQHYRIDYQTDPTGNKVEALSWTKQPRAGTQLSNPGLYCLRSNETSWTPERAVAHLCHAHRFGGGVPQPEVGARAAPDLPPKGSAQRWASLHLGARLSVRADHPQSARRSRHPPELDQPTQDLPSTAPRDQQLQDP